MEKHCRRLEKYCRRLEKYERRLEKYERHFFVPRLGTNKLSTFHLYCLALLPGRLSLQPENAGFSAGFAAKCTPVNILKGKHLNRKNAGLQGFHGNRIKNGDKP
ncbi:MAG: hypothetical protein K6D37_02190 [Prevotella sp.]|nr:hypothetical protein [Prevotella sp.]